MVSPLLFEQNWPKTFRSKKAFNPSRTEQGALLVYHSFKNHLKAPKKFFLKISQKFEKERDDHGFWKTISQDKWSNKRLLIHQGLFKGALLGYISLKNAS